MRRISTPTAAQDLFGPGKHGFRNGDPANAILATRLHAEFFNALQEEVASFIEQAGIALDAMDNAQLLKAFRAHRGGAGTGFGHWAWSAGTAGDPGAGKVGLNNADPALATQVLLAEVSGESVDYSMVLSAAQAGDTLYLQPRDGAALGHRFKVTGAPTDNGGYRTIPVAYISGSGGLPAANTAMLVRLAQTTAADVSTDGVAGTASNLKASATGTNSTVTVTADSVCVKNATGQQKVLNGVALAINSASSGANGLDTGALAASTWYSVWVIYNPTTLAVSGLLSLNATAPTLPAGYTHKARVGWIRTDSTANKYPVSFLQNGRSVRWKVAAGSNLPNLPILASGVAGTTSAFVPVGVANYVPPTAPQIFLQLVGNYATNSAAVAPNSTYVFSTEGGNSPQLQNSQGAAVATGISSSGLMTLESANVYWFATGSSSLNCLGWEDSL